MKIARRRLIQGGAAAAAALLPLPFLFRRPQPAAAGRLRPDPEGLLDLADGLSYSVLEQQFAPMSDGYQVPALPDGMACFPGPGGTLVLMRNHEISLPAMLGPYRRGQVPPEEAYDPGSFGGVTRLVVQATTLERVSSNLVLTGTQRNCSGGPSPWGWLSCEESTRSGHGYVFLCPTDAERVQPPRRIVGYGRFNHEAVAIDPRTNVAYLTEDRGDSCLYRFVPHSPADPFTGKLQALAATGTPRLNTGSMTASASVAAHWVDVDDPDPEDDVVRRQAQQRGALLVCRGEGICFHGGSIYVCSTSGGRANAGQVLQVTLEPGQERLSVLTEADARNGLDGPDNITPTPWGDLVVAEDGDGDQYLRGIRPDGSVYEIARNARSSGELCGVCLSPDGDALFVNLQREGLTLAIRGPLREIGAAASS